MTQTRNFREAIANIVCPEQRRERRDLARAVNTDPLTKLANRRAFDLALPAAEADPDIVVILFDANNFGKLNKISGHAFGDQILIEMAAALKSAAGLFAGDERVFRIGGDEFAILADRDSATRIRDRAESSFGIRFPAIEVSISGTIGETAADADAGLQIRKSERKGANGPGERK